MKERIIREQVIPIILTILTFLVLCVALYFSILLLNLLPTQEKIALEIRKRDILVGLTIYLKTAIDFAIFIGNLMRSNPGWKKRIAIEVGTAVGNMAGTIVVLVLWNFFREIPILMAIMIFVASLVLLRMAQESIEEFLHNGKNNFTKFHTTVSFLNAQLATLNTLFKPLLGRLIPNTSITNTKTLSFWNLVAFSFTIPFILGLDDFAGYIPLFSIINVFGFAIGVFLGHMILNAALFVSPDKTTKLVRHPAVLIIGGIAFVGIAAWGFYEVSHILLALLTH